MYLVIFKATTATLDEEYIDMAQELKKLAFSKYGCLDFTSVTEADQEIAISYWPSLQHIRDWKNDPSHRLAQIKGKDKWYSKFSVEICELVS
jgi:heme-degrading monooxygenase HmoA